MRKKKKLGHRILSIFLLSTILASLTMALAFHYLMLSNIKKLTKASMDIEFETRKIDNINDQNEYFDFDKDVFFPVHTIIRDPNQGVGSYLGDWYSKEEGEMTRAILASQARVPLAENDPTRLKIGGQTILVEKRLLRGTFDGYYIQAQNRPREKAYEVYVYTNIESLEGLNQKMDFYIMLFFGASSLLSILVTQVLLKKLHLSLNTLKAYLSQVGKRKFQNPPLDLEFEEFDQVVETIEGMVQEIAHHEQVQKNFFSNASHELKTPLTVIQGFTEGMLHGVVEKERALPLIYKHSQKMANLVNEILYFTKFEEMKEKREEVELQGLTYDLVHGFMTEKNKHIDFKIDFQDQYILWADPDLMDKAISNLVSNACRYAQSLVQISGHDLGTEFCLQVMDDGEGIDPQDLPHLFEKFYKGKGGNFGIGLALVKEIMERYKGRVEVESAPGRTVFSLYFPKE